MSAEIEIKADSWTVVFFTVVWIVGIVLAKGFWSTVAAFFIPPWGWYLIAERGLQLAGWI